MSESAKPHTRGLETSTVGEIPTWLLVAVIVAGYFWIAVVPGAPLSSRNPDGYYNLQTTGFLKGHLYLPIKPRLELLALPDPYDPTANASYRVHDLSSRVYGRYTHGKAIREASSLNVAAAVTKKIQGMP